MLQYSPKIVTDSLVMCLDASNNKSYPTTDLPVKNGLVMWMDAADDTTFSYSSGTTVTQWRDKSGFNYHMGPKVNGPTRNAFLNSRKVLAFTTSQTIGNDVIDLSSSTSTVFVVSRYVTGTNQRVLTCNLDSGGGNWLLGHWGGYVNQYYAEGWVSFQVYGNDTVWRVYMGDYSGPPAGVNTDLANIYSNGTAIVTNSTAASGGLRKLGINYYSNETSTCEVAEIIVFNRVLSTVERRLVHTYLGQKWGISNTDRQIFDLSGNNFNFAFNGTNPRYNAKTIVSNFDTASPFAVSSFGGQNLTSNILNLLYSDHTIEVAFNAKGFRSVYSYDNTLTTQDGQSIVLWTGRHSGLRVYQNTIIYEYWNSQSSTVGIGVNISSYIDKIIYITATRTGDVLRLYINGVLSSGPTTVAATTSPVSYSQINIGAAYQGNPTTQGFIWAGQHEYHLLRMYNRQLTDTEVASNYQAFKARFDNNIVRFGLVLDLDAGNPYSYAGAGSTWFDVSGNARNATVNGAITFSDNYFNTGSTGTITNYITIPSAALNSLTSWTIQLWLNINSTNSIDTFLTCGAGNDFLWFFDGRSNLAFQNTSSSSIPYPTTIGEWFLFTATGTGGSISVYKNGSSLGSFSNTTSITVNSAFGIVLGQELDDNTTGAFDATQAFLGKYGSVSFYNRVLSAAEVLQNYNATKSRFGL
jgi:hypothetical protein